MIHPARPASMPGDLIIEGARQHNLKNISVRIPHNAVTAITGLSGSGKSSLAFDTLFAEGQWRYVESLSTYARMFLERLDRPDVDRLINIRPAIAIEQKNTVRTARSTVATSTEIADLLRLLFATIGRPLCPDCQQEARGYTSQDVADVLFEHYSNLRASILFPIQDIDLLLPDRALISALLRRGFVRVKHGDQILDLDPDSTLPTDERSTLHVVLDRLVLRPDNRSRLIEAVETAFRESGGVCRVEIVDHLPRVYNTRFQCQLCGRTFPVLRPLLFSFNHPLGACPQCNGFGNVLRYDEELVVPDRNRSLVEGAIEPWTKPASAWWHKQMLVAMKRRGISLTTPYAKLPERDRRLLWEGSKNFEGIRQFFEYLEGKRYKMHVRVLLSRYRSPFPCTACGGSRLRPEARLVKIAGTDIHEASEMTIDTAATWLDYLNLSEFETRVSQDVLRRLTAKLEFLKRVGLGYLTLSRQTRTLSGGEAQRITLATQLGSHLIGTLYVLDEPTIGLHARDTGVLTGILGDLAASGNTVVVVEHDRQMIMAADHIIELGPASGEQGGRVMYVGPRHEFLAQSDSITARYLRGDQTIPIPRNRRRGTGDNLMLTGACAHNLKNLSVRVPLGMLVCVTGVSGSGKSTLVETTLYRALARVFRLTSLPMGRFTALKGAEHLQGVRLIDQQPIGRTPRSNPVTYLKAFDEIRRMFASQPEAARQGLAARDFSFNQPGGRCERCEGNGYEHLEMYFFEDVYATCDLCNGRRFGERVLRVRYRNKTIDDILNMTFDEAAVFFAGHRSGRLTKTLHLLSSIGLGYLRLGQPATTLSGGEAQRLKIAAETQSATKRHLLYVLDEPTTGLHPEDIRKLLLVVGTLIDAGNTVLLVEHNLEVIKTADWIIDLGPEGGNDGGRIVAEGRPEQVAQNAASHTGRFLRPLLNLSL